MTTKRAATISQRRVSARTATVGAPLREGTRGAGSGRRLPPEEIAVLTLHHQLARLVVHGGPHGDHAGGAPGLEPSDGEQRVERVAHVDRLEEARRLVEEGHQRVADRVREDAGARRGLGGDEEAVGQEVAVAVGPAVLAIVVDRVVVGGGELERGEERLGHGTRGNREALAPREVVEPARGGEPVLLRAEGRIGHGAAPRGRQRAGAGAEAAAAGAWMRPGSSETKSVVDAEMAAMITSRVVK